MRALALLALFAACACAMQTVTVKMCAYQEAAPFKCDLNCTSFVVPANKCMWNDVFKSPMSFTCRLAPKCMTRTYYRFPSCNSDYRQLRTTAACGCDTYLGESLLCLDNEVIVQKCKNSACSVGCNTTLDAVISECTYFQSASFVGSVLVEKISNGCYMVDVKLFGNSECDSLARAYTKGSGDCNDVEYFGGKAYSVSYTCSNDWK